MVALANLYSPPDVGRANDAWGCNCGPAALAAVLRVPAMAVWRLFPGWAGYTNPTHMLTALERAGRRFARKRDDAFPTYGLAFLQIEGPWCRPRVPVGAQYQRTHWIAAAIRDVTSQDSDSFIYGVNAGLWLPGDEWERDVMSQVVAGHRNATGWRLRTAIEVRGERKDG